MGHSFIPLWAGNAVDDYPQMQRRGEDGTASRSFFVRDQVTKVG
jgi:hypothetical protein